MSEDNKPDPPGDGTPEPDAFAQGGYQNDGNAARDRVIKLDEYDRDEWRERKKGGGPPGGGSGGVVEAPRPPWCSDDALAAALATRILEDYRYVPGWGWHCWDGKQWKADDGNSVVERARENCRVFAAEIVKWAAEAEEKKKVDGWCRQIASARTIRATVDLAKSDIRLVAPSELFERVNGHLLNTPSGIVDLSTGLTGPHRRDAYLTNLTLASPGGDCPKWKAFIREFTGGNEEYAQYLQRVAGYCLTGYVYRPSWFFLWGRHGGEGKGVFIRTLHKMLGDYAGTAMMGMFAVTQGERHPTELAALRGKRLVVATETTAHMEWDEAKLKMLLGGDKISARVSRGDPFEFTPICKLLMSGNHRPRLRSADPATQERLNLCPAQHRPETVDPHLDDKLEAELGGILAWAIEGAYDWFKKRGVKPPSVVTEATTGYFIGQNPVARWFEQCCDKVAPDPNGDDNAAPFLIKTRSLYSSFKQWQLDGGEKVWSEPRFTEKLLMIDGVRYRRSKLERGWVGLKLKPIPDDEAPLV